MVLMKKSKIQNPCPQLLQRCRRAKSKSLGFTLVEILVAMAIFSIVTGVAIGIFAMAMKSQRNILAQQQLLDETSYVMEYMSRAIRMAKKDLNNNCIATNANYELTASSIKFKNYDGICQKFYLSGTQIKEDKGPDTGLALTPPLPGLTVNSFKIISSGETQDDNFQPAIALLLDISGEEGTKIKIQTTISQRNLDVKY